MVLGGCRSFLLLVTTHFRMVQEQKNRDEAERTGL